MSIHLGRSDVLWWGNLREAELMRNRVFTPQAI